VKRLLNARWIALAALAASLGGCVTIFPKTIPSQLYRFQVAAAPEAAAPASGAEVSVVRAQTSFVRGAEGDQILTSNGDQVAYIAGARWVAPAASLFDEAESQAFDQSGSRVRLARRGEFVSAPISLRLDVGAFEARYLDGPTAAPTVVIKIRAIITRVADRRVLAVRDFESRKPAGENRVGPIVTGFDAALSDALGQIVGWTDSQAVAAASVADQTR
jgi:cholesterol transport system auxiliary component